MEEEEKDDNSDVLTRFTNFVDNNLRLFRVRIKKQYIHTYINFINVSSMILFCDD